MLLFHKIASSSSPPGLGGGGGFGGGDGSVALTKDPLKPEGRGDKTIGGRGGGWTGSAGGVGGGGGGWSKSSDKFVVSVSSRYSSDDNEI